MTSMVEKMARAMEEAQEHWALGTDNQAWECPYDVTALAALKAMREPTEAMTMAAFTKDAGDYENDATAYYEDIWEHMIDAAIAEAGK